MTEVTQHTQFDARSSFATIACLDPLFGAQASLDGVKKSYISTQTVSEAEGGGSGEEMREPERLLNGQQDLGSERERASLVVQWSRILLPKQKMGVQPLGQEDPLEKGMTTHFSILAGKTP